MSLTQEQKRTIKNIARKHGVTNLRVFGSVARGEETIDSDIDLLITTPAGFTLLDLAALKLELEEAMNRGIDVAIERGLKPRIREYVLAEARPL